MRWQDYLILALLAAAFLLYRLGRRRGIKVGPRRRKKQLTRREEAILIRLKARGYRLEEAHPEVTVTLTVDQKSRPFNYQGAFIVKKGGKSYLVKIKRGSATPLGSAALRSETLLDYLFFKLDGILFYDPEKDNYQVISFQLGGGGPVFERRMLQLVLITLIAIGIAILYRILGGS